MIEIISNVTNKPIQFDHFFFGGGEQHIKLKNCDNCFYESATIWLYYGHDSNIWQLALIVDALRRHGCSSIALNIPYFPAARQDRVCVAGEPLTVKVFADFINAMKFSRVTIFDPHSEVTPALLDNVRVVDNTQFVGAAFKKSAKGLTAVFKDANGEFYLKDQATWDEVNNCEFVEVFENGKLVKDYTLQEVRNNLAQYV